MTHYALAWTEAMAGDSEEAERVLDQAAQQSADYLFPSRIHEQIVLEWAAALRPDDGRAIYGLGNLLFHNNRDEEAIERWEACTGTENAPAQAYRNLGIAYWNTRHDAEMALKMYRTAMDRDPDDGRIVTELAQLLGKTGASSTDRLELLETHKDLLSPRDDAMVELALLYNETGSPEKALELLIGRSFHPWEGGEGKVLRQYVRAHLALGKRALADGNPETAIKHFERAMETPDELGEKFHPLQAKADVLFWQGEALRALGRNEEADQRYTSAAEESGDFEQMAVAEFSELTYFRALSLERLGRKKEAQGVAHRMKEYTEAEKQIPAKIDYFATSLPNLLVFDEDLDTVKEKRLEMLADLADRILAGQ
jgi:tetratricopeptide (TPR) repeat protein